jgi:NaMN:DMB phosphoribosyltransferase
VGLLNDSIGGIAPLETLAIQIAGITGQARPRLLQPMVIVMAGDHGVGMRLGEGTGAVLAQSLCQAACKAFDEMATFGEAGVSGNETR